MNRSSLRLVLQNPWFQAAFGTALSAAALYLTFRGIDLRQLGDALTQVELRFAAAAAAVFLLTQWVKAWRWRSLLGKRLAGLGVMRLANHLVIGQALNMLLPARLGDLVRIYLAGTEGNASKAYVLGTVAAEKLMDLVGLAAVFLGLLPLMAMPSWLAPRAGPVAGAAAVMVVGAAAVLATRRRWEDGVARLLCWLPERWQSYLQLRISSGLSGLASLADPGQALAAWLWTALIWLLGGLTNLLLLLAFRMGGSWLWALFLLVVLQAGVVVPSGPGRLGVFEYLCQLGLAAFGVPLSVGLAYGLLLHGLVIVGTGMWAALALWSRSRSPWRLVLDSASWQSPPGSGPEPG